MQVPSFEESPSDVTSSNPSIYTLPPDTPERRASSRSSADPRIVGKDHRKRVLIVGRIRELALYRAEVLNRAGFEARIPDTTEDTVRMIEAGDFDVAVLSYTLPSDLVQELAERLRQSRPEGAIVAIADTNRIDRRISPDAVALAEHGPAGLLSAVQQVLRRR